MGLAIARGDPGRAAALFEQAIEADRSYAAAYLSLGRALLDSGTDAKDVTIRLRRLLDQAPDREGLFALRRRFKEREDSAQQLK